MKNRIAVIGTLPSMAYLRLDEAPDEEGVLSTHVLSWCGLYNAVQSAKAAHNWYTRTHGNMAAHVIRIVVCGIRSTVDYWQTLLEWEGPDYDTPPQYRLNRTIPPLNADNINAIVEKFDENCKAVDAEMTTRLEAETQAAEAEWEAFLDAEAARWEAEHSPLPNGENGTFADSDRSISETLP